MRILLCRVRKISRILFLQKSVVMLIAAGDVGVLFLEGGGGRWRCWDVCVIRV